MNHRIMDVIDTCVMGLFIILFGLTLYFAGASVNLQRDGVTFAGVVGVLVLVGSYLITQTTLLPWCYTHRMALLSGGFIIAIMWQFTFVTLFHPAIGFDAGAIHEALQHPEDIDLIGYFSQNTNNLPLLLVYDWLSNISHTISWLFFDYVSLICVDAALLVNLVTMCIVRRENVGRLLWIETLFMLVFPWIVVPYSDTAVLPLVALLFLLMACLQKAQAWWQTLILSALLAACAVATYFIKPSAIIPLIALCLVLIRSVITSDKVALGKRLKTACLVIVTITVSGLGAYTVGQQVIDAQTVIRINKGLTIPPIHFMSMGVSGDGGYNEADALKMAELPKRSDKVDYSKQQLIKRLREKGVVGYLAFLVKKQGNNTADGTFAWLKEGHFFKNGHPNEPKWLSNWVTTDGKHLKDLQFITQMWWLLILVTIAIGLRKQDDWSRLCWLAILGGFMYLLLFEGGRSRYLIQFLPAFLILAAYQAGYVWQLFNRFGKRCWWIFFGKEYAHD